MADMMTFPDTWEEFEEQYGFTDKKQIYTNGSRLIQSFRVKQWLDHLESEHKQADTPQTDFPTEWCETCELWQDNNCRGVAECKRNIEMLKGLNKLYEADTPQTEKTCDNCGTSRDKCVYCIEEDRMWTPQTDCGWGEPNE